MRHDGNKLRLSASDLAKHLGCRYLTVLDGAAAEGRFTKKRWHDPMLEALQQRGLEHEQAYVERLREKGLEVVELEAEDDAGTAVERTIEAARAGPDVIVQATLQDGRWFGRADILRKVERPSELGDYAYEVIDTKLAQETKAGTILQLSLYSELVAKIQGVMPERMYVVIPGNDFDPLPYRVAEYAAYYRHVKAALEAAVDGEPLDPGDAGELYPEPVAQCDVCDWWSYCNDRRHEDDHLSLVAGITKLQRKEVESRGIETLTDLAGWEVPDDWRPDRGTREGYAKAQEQATIQLESRNADQVLHRLLPYEHGRGLAELPEPSEGDLFFDIEGDPFVGEGGLEYLFGVAYLDADGELRYEPRWALTPADERQAFEAFIDFVVERLETYPDLHIYHYAPYEPGAVKRLMGRHSTREIRVDELLRGERFVDLYQVVRRSMRVGVERYSIKELEPLYGFERTVELHEASSNLRRLEHVLEMGRAADIDEATREKVTGYNRDDCVSTRQLRDWLETQRAELERSVGSSIPRPEIPPPESNEELSEWEQRIEALQQRLTDGVPELVDDRTREQHAAWILSQVLEFHRREDKSTFWERYRLRDLPAEELQWEKRAVYGLESVDTVGGTEACPIHRYRFPPQDTDVRPEDDAHLPGGDKLGTVADVNPQAETVDIKKMKKTAETHPEAFYAHNYIGTKVLKESLERLALWVADHGLDTPGPYRAARDLLLRHPPRLANGLATAELQKEHEAPTAACRRVVQELADGTLAIQGPPGAGKTFTGARMILELVKQGKRVGVTATSHQVIRNFFEELGEAAKIWKMEIACIEKVKHATDDPPPAHRGDEEQREGARSPRGRNRTSRRRHRLDVGPGRLRRHRRRAAGR